MIRNQNPAQAGELFAGKVHDSFFLNEYGRIESLRAARYDTGFSVVLVTIETADRAKRGGGKGGKTRKKRAGGPARGELITEVSSVVTESLRSCDVVGLTEEGSVAAILPETDYFGALATIKKLRKAVGQLPAVHRDIEAAFSQATYLRDGHAFEELLGVAEERAFELRDSLRTTLDLDSRLFWEVLAALFASDSGGPKNSSFDTGGAVKLPPAFLDRVSEQVVREITRAPHKKGILYLCPRPGAPTGPMARLLESAARTKTKVFVVGSGRERLDWVKDASTVPLDDPRLDDLFFAFHLGSEAAYAFMGRELWGETYSCFHSADDYLVEGLITKLQEEYQLQEQLG
ncbi:MAG: hypothetical protein ACE5EI_04010 [Thermodesulfobacteriota bacterium]